MPGTLLRAAPALCLALACAGCGTFRYAAPPAQPPEFALDAEGLRLARALAEYGDALLSENESGWDDPATAEWWDRAAASDPGRPRLYLRAAAVHFQRGETDKARAILERGRDANPRHAETRLALALACEAANALDRAAAECRAAIRLKPEAPTPYIRLAGIHFRRNEYRAACRVLEAGLKRVENKTMLTAACVSHGARLASAGQTDRAVRCFDVALRHDPSLKPDFHVFYADLYREKGDTQRARRYLRKAVRLRPPQPEAFLRLADYYSTENLAKALALLRRAQDLIPADPRVHFAVAFMLTADERFEAAVTNFRRAEELIAGTDGAMRMNDRFYLYYGAALERSGRINEAAQVFEDGLARFPDCHEILNYLAYMWADAGLELEKSMAHVIRALKLEPDNGAYVDTLGWVHYRLKEYPDALREITRASQLIKDDPTIIEHLGDVYAALGQTARAIAEWRRSLALDSSNANVAAKLREQNVDVESIPRGAKTSP
ncbi:MAG: tetratricopeptide repeat protein [Lentisphaerae bacterium]|nr:tetratricopeptide repeat protein [Lentisphaerota bacterium]